MTTSTIIAYVITFAVPGFALYAISALDLFGTGKISTKVICALWGAFGAFFLALNINNAMFDIVGEALLITVTAPIVEEIAKSLILVYFIQQPRFRYVVDGAIYGFATGIGFALMENLYIYLPESQALGEVLAGAISRVLAPTLMHATASALVGICLGFLRRTERGLHQIIPVVGIALAITLHSIFNRVAHSNLDPTVLLLIAIVMGIGGSVVIALLINRALDQEKKRFSKTLGMKVDVSEGERQSVQRLGGAGFEQLLEDLSETFGEENIILIRRLFVVQANIGILENNLAETNVSERLRKAWEEEIAELQTEKDDIRKKLSRYIMSYLGNVFPATDAVMGEKIAQEIADSDPTLVHTFDMFTRQAQLAQSFTPDELTNRAERLQKITYFKNISLANLENLSRAITLEEFPEGQQLFDKGDKGDTMYMIEEGNIAIYTLDRETREKLLRIFVPGQVVGEMAVLDSGPRSARARAVKNVRALALTQYNFNMFIQSRPQVITAVLEVLADKARYTTRLVEEARDMAVKIANGEYKEVQEAATQAAPPTPVSADQPRSAAPAVPDKELAEMSFNSMNRFIKGAFSHLAETLQQREESLSAQGADAE